MMKTVSGMYITMLPLIFGGIANMVFTRTSFYRAHRRPIDGYRVWKDERRILGDNKTIAGFFSMIVFVIFFQILWGVVCRISGIGALNEWYLLYRNDFPTNVITGFLTGFFYMLFELPNSFLKRRLSIPDGKTVGGVKGVLFFLIDQTDSLTGVFLVLAVCSHISLFKYFGYLLLGAGTHIAVNTILYLLKIRKNI